MFVNRQRKALIKVGYACNNRCVFCHSAPHRGLAAAPLAALRAKVTAARLRGFEMIVLSGGEPTSYSELGALLAHVQREGLALGFVTNGRRFAHAPFADGIAALRLGYVYMSLHGARPETHDRLVGAKAHTEVLAGLRNLAGRPGLHLTVNTVVTQWNLDELEAITALLCDIGDLRIKYSYLEPRGDALERLDELLVAPDVVAERILAIMEAYDDRAAETGVELAWDALPFCLMRGREAAYDDLVTNRIEVMSEAFESAFFAVDHSTKEHAEVCKDCTRKDICPGLYHDALVRFGSGSFRPYLPDEESAKDAIDDSSVNLSETTTSNPADES